MAEELEVMRNWVAELGGEKEKFKEELATKAEKVTSLQKELENEKKLTQVLAAEAQAMKNWVAELGGEKEKCREELATKAAEVTSLQKELDNEKKLIQVLAAEAQVMKNWVAELGGENATLQDEEGANRSRNLQDALQHGKEMENLLREEKMRGNEMAAFLRTFKVELNNRDLQIENLLNMKRKLISEKEELLQELGVALSHSKELDSLLEEAGKQATKLANDFEEEVQKREDQMKDFLGKEEQLRVENLELEDRLENAVNLLIKEERENVTLAAKSLTEEEDGRLEDR
ncbi:myosin-10-like [Macrobrachium nipponense]|uniref:myosin-10-like n=1 Tax=Macrobrachium nipponense TaxID=159736 RepID=UPI0030C87723